MILQKGKEVRKVFYITANTIYFITDNNIYFTVLYILNHARISRAIGIGAGVALVLISHYLIIFIMVFAIFKR